MSRTQPMLPSRGVKLLVLWPFTLAWRLATLITNIIGIVLALVFGLVLMGVGILLSSTIVGAVVGIPLGVLGLLLLVRALY